MTQSPSGPDLPLRSPQVFVVEDDEAVRTAVSLLVRTCGWDAVPCLDGADFLARYTRGENQCVVVDLRMPGMSGVEVQKELRRRGDDVPVIVVTAHHDQPEANSALRDGAQAVLAKPFNDDELLAWVDRALTRD